MSKTIRIRATRATVEVLAEMEGRGLLKRLFPSHAAQTVSQGNQVVERVELAREESGPWQMLVVACNRTKLTYLASHSDIESWLFWSHDPRSKPLLYIVAAIPADEFERKAREGRLEAGDFVALELRPNDAFTSYFTVPANVLHDELTYDGEGTAPIFYVPEPANMTHKRVALDGYEITVERAAANQTCK